MIYLCSLFAALINHRYGWRCPWILITPVFCCHRETPGLLASSKLLMRKMTSQEWERRGNWLWIVLWYSGDIQLDYFCASSALLLLFQTLFPFYFLFNIWNLQVIVLVYEDFLFLFINLEKLFSGHLDIPGSPVTAQCQPFGCVLVLEDWSTVGFGGLVCWVLCPVLFDWIVTVQLSACFLSSRCPHTLFSLTHSLAPPIWIPVFCSPSYTTTWLCYTNPTQVGAILPQSSVGIKTLCWLSLSLFTEFFLSDSPACPVFTCFVLVDLMPVFACWDLFCWFVDALYY